MKTITTISRKLLVMMIALLSSITVWGQDVDSLMTIFKQQMKLNVSDNIAIIDIDWHLDFDIDSAIKTAEKILFLTPDIVTDSANIDFILSLAKSYDVRMKYDKSIELYKDVVKIYQKTTGKKAYETAKILNAIGNRQLILNKYNEALSTFLQVEEAYKERFGEDSQEYADILVKIGLKYLGFDFKDEDKEFDKSAYYFSRAKQLHVKIKGYNSLEVAEDIENLAIYYKKYSEYKNAIDCYKEAKNIYIKQYGYENNKVLHIIESIIGICQFQFEDANNLTECLNELKEIHIKTDQENSIEAAIMLTTIGYCYLDVDDYKNALGYFIQAKDVLCNNLRSQHDNYPNPMAEMFYFGQLKFTCDFIRKVYGFDKAIDYYIQEQGNFINMGDDYSVLIASEMSLHIADCYFNQGDYNKALYYYCKRKDEHKNIKYSNIGNNYHLADIIESVGNCYQQMHDSEHAIDYYSQAIALFQKAKYDKYDKNDSEIARVLKAIGDCYLFSDKEYSKAIQYYKESNILDSQTIFYLGICYYYLKEYSQALDYCLKSREIYKTKRVNDIEFETKLNKMIARIYYDIKDYSNAYSYISETVNTNYNDLIDWIYRVREFYRIKYWNDISELFMSEFPSIALAKIDKQAVCALYDKSALFAKGLLLITDNDIRHFIYESGDSILISTFNELQKTQKLLTKLNERYSDAIDNNHITSLELEAEKLENKIMVRLNKMKEFKEYKQNLQLTWKDVQAKLGDKDIAIEFLSFSKLGDENTTMYIALIVRPGYDYPHMIELCEENDLIAAKENAYTGPELSKLIWKELADAGELKGVDNIYFSPSGLLHTIAIESVPHWSKKGVMMSDTFNIYRLSSTRELALKRKMVDGVKGASVYGGISYNAPVEAMGAPRFGGRETYFAAADLPSPEVMPTQNNQNRAYHVVELEDGTRALQWDSLPGSSEEAIAVTSLLESKMDTHLMTDLVSTEASFKELSGQKRKLIHIATHGFYWSDSTALRHKQMVLMPSNYEKMQEQDKSMVRSGLLFSGAQNTFFHKVIPEGVDDGILTAQEVSNIDLRGLDLVVLSACQTALGEISGEGVFGLQRGFKMAGAQSIIMSLWSVSDKATQDMMTEFYKAYNPDINNKREAFFIAQKFVKEHDSDYTYSNDEDEDLELRNTQPHWAAFILLDALD